MWEVGGEKHAEYREREGGEENAEGHQESASPTAANISDECAEHHHRCRNHLRSQRGKRGEDEKMRRRELES